MNFCRERVLLGPALGRLLSVLRHCTENWQYPDPSEVAGLAFPILYMVSILLLLLSGIPKAQRALTGLLLPTSLLFP